LAGNTFPITEGAYLQDPTHRLTVLVDHATAVSSPRPGSLQLAVDKRTAYDDGRGMGEGVLDSRPTRHRYVLLLEPRAAGAREERAAVLPALSPLALTLARQLESPLSIFLHQEQQQQAQQRLPPEMMKQLPELGTIVFNPRPLIRAALVMLVG
jgi:hypothetical protein